MNTALNRTTLAFLTNKSGGDLAYGDVVVLDNSNANGFTTTTTAGLSTRGLGVIFDVAGIANNATGAVAIGGWCPQVNLNAAATVGQFVKTHTVAGQATPHSSPQVEGDFGVALTASATPPALLFGSANPPGGSGSGTVTNTGTLTDHALIVGNGGVDVSALGSLGTTTTVLHGNAAGDPTFAAVDLTADVTGDLPLANVAQLAGLSVLGVTGSATADMAAITASADGQVLKRVSSSSLVFSSLGVPNYIVCASDESDTDNTFHSDAELLFSVGTSQIWLVEVLLYVQSGASATPDIKVTWAIPASATVSMAVLGELTTSTALTEGGTFQETSPSSFGRGVDANATNLVHVWTTLRTAGTGGTMQFQWAQNTTNATATVRKADSWMRYTRIA